MAIRVDCGYCGRIHHLGDQFAGKKIACMACKTPIEVPAPAVRAAEATQDPENGEARSAAGAAPAKRETGKLRARRKIKFAPEKSDSWVFAVPAPVENPYPAPRGQADDFEEEPIDDEEDAEDELFEPAERRRKSSKKSRKTAEKRKRQAKSTLSSMEFTTGHFCGLLALVFLLSIPLMFVFPLFGTLFAIIWLILWAISHVVASIWIISIAFEEDLVCGLLILFVPFYFAYFILTRWNFTWRPLAITATMFGLTMCSGWVGQMYWKYHLSQGIPENQLWVIDPPVPPPRAQPTEQPPMPPEPNPRPVRTNRPRQPDPAPHPAF